MSLQSQIPQLEDYGLSEEYGFLPSGSPLERLHNACYDPWEDIMSNMSGLITNGQLRSVVNDLPIISTAQLKHESEWRRAYSILSIMAQAYIWGNLPPSKRLPPAIAVPLSHAASWLEVPPVATYAALCLWNFKLLSSQGSSNDPQSLRALNTFTGSTDESWFYMISVAIEKQGAPALGFMLKAVEAARRGESSIVVKSLMMLSTIISDIDEILGRLPDKCAPGTFYAQIRPFLAGFKHSAGVPDGVIYEDGTQKVEKKRFHGGSNAQSSLVQFFDIILGIKHDDYQICAENNDLRDHAGNFLEEMRNYMPGSHRRFLQDVIKVANIRSYVEMHPANVELIVAYDSCCKALWRLRQNHLKIVTRYIIIRACESRMTAECRNSHPTQSKVDFSSRSSCGQGNKDDLNLRGTGGTQLIPFLKKISKETASYAMTVSI